MEGKIQWGGILGKGPISYHFQRIRKKKRLCAEKERKGKGRRRIRNKLIPRPHSPLLATQLSLSDPPIPIGEKGAGKGKKIPIYPPATQIHPSDIDPRRHTRAWQIFSGEKSYFLPICTSVSAASFPKLTKRTLACADGRKIVLFLFSSFFRGTESSHHRNFFSPILRICRRINQQSTKIQSMSPQCRSHEMSLFFTEVTYMYGIRKTTYFDFGIFFA